MDRNVQDYKKLIAKMAWQYLPSFSKCSTAKTIQDLMSDGYETFVNVCIQEKRKPLTCPFHTALGVQMKQRWLNELESLTYKKRGGDCEFISHEDEPKLESYSLHCTSQFERVDRFLDLPSEMKIVVKLLMNSPTELVEISKSTSLSNSLGVYLRKFCNMKPKEVKKLQIQLATLTK
jgi:hypothetical protein